MDRISNTEGVPLHAMNVHLQLDNTASTNKNVTVFTFMAAAVQVGICRSFTAIVVATDGSAKDGVAAAAHSVVVNQCDRAFFGGNDSEDQSSFRAKMCALKLALEAVLAAVNQGARGRVILAVDCAAALKARFSCPSMPLFGVRLRSLVSDIRSSGFEVTFSWAHNRHPGWRSPHPAFSVEQLRSLNDAADRSAKACVARRLHGSLREKWVAEAAQIKRWEANAVRASVRAAQRLSDHLEACAATRATFEEGSDTLLLPPLPP